MKIYRNTLILLGLVTVAMTVAPTQLLAATNGFIVPAFRGTANSQFGYWEAFTTPAGAPGNLPDQPGATTSAVLTQTDANGLLTGSSNIYNTSGSSFELTNATPFTLGTVVLQTRTVGSELAYSSVSLTYWDTNSVPHLLAPLFRYELNRAVVPGQGNAVSSLWQWNLTGLTASNYSITFNASEPHLSFDSMTLDTVDQFGAVLPAQPFLFNLDAAPAKLARWMYPFNGNPAARTTVNVFGALGNTPTFDSRDAQTLLGWKTTIPTGLGADNYLIRRARVTLTLANTNYTYTGTLRDYRTYFPTNDPRYLSSSNSSSPVELFGAGFRGGFTNQANAFVPYAATNYPQAGPFFGTTPPPGIYSSNRAAYAAGFDTNGLLVDVSNNVGDNGTNGPVAVEVPNPFEVAPFGVGQTTSVGFGQLMPVGSQLTFDLNLNDPQIYRYVQIGLNDGNLSFVLCSLVNASLTGPASYPIFYSPFSSIADERYEYPLVDLEGAIVRPALDSDSDGLPDDWENFYFGSLSNSANNNADGDGANNLAEFQAGTSPTNATSTFLLRSVLLAANAAEVHFDFAPGRQYTIGYADDLPNWQTVTNPVLNYSSAWLAKTGTNLVYPAPVYAVWRDINATNAQRFYRVSAH